MINLTSQCPRIEFVCDRSIAGGLIFSLIRLSQPNFSDLRSRYLNNSTNNKSNLKILASLESASSFL